MTTNAAASRLIHYPITRLAVGSVIVRALQRSKNRQWLQPHLLTVVEDDAELTPDFAGVLKAIEQQQPDFDFIFLHRKFKGEKFCYSLPATRWAFQTCHAWARVGPAHMGAIAYVVSKTGAQKFLAYAPRFAHAVDKEMHRYWANGLDIYGLERPVVVHADRGHSFIEETRDQERPKERARYPDANALYWRLARGATRLSDSVQKRLAWPAYVRKGKWSQ